MMYIMYCFYISRRYCNLVLNNKLVISDQVFVCYNMCKDMRNTEFVSIINLPKNKCHLCFIHSQVYWAMDSDLNPWAVKKVDLKNLTQETVTSYINEIEMLKSLINSDRIIRLYDQ